MRPAMFPRYGVRARRAAAAAAVVMSMLALSACGTDDAEPDNGHEIEDLEDEFLVTGESRDGTEEPRFIDDLGSYDGQVVTVSSDILEVISPNSFVIGGPDEVTLDPVLVVSADEIVLDPDLEARVTGVVHLAFDLATAEAELGLDLPDEVYRDWDGETFIVATDVKVTDF